TGIGVIAAGVAVAVAVVGFLVLAPRGSSAPRRATPPPRAAEAPEPPPLETPAAPQVFSRGTDLSRAKQLIEKGDWIAARDELRTLRGRAQEAAEIDRLLAEVERRLEARAASARAAEEAKQRMDKGEWEAARGLLGPIAAEDAEARACIEKCRREIEAGSEIVKLDEMKAQGSWSDIVKLGGRVESDFGDTAAFAAARGSIHQARDEAKRELEAQDLLTGAREGRAQARWDRVLEKLAQLDRLSQTRTASGAREEMDGLRREAVQEIDRGQVQQMTQAWDAAMALVKEKKWAEAKAALLKLREVLGQTQFFRDRERTWKTAVDECDQEIARARDREAAELWKEAQGKMREEDPKPALAALKRLVEEFAETRWFQSRRRMIESKIAELEKRAAAPPPSSPAPLFDFEAGPGDWYPDTGGGLPKGTAEAVEGGYESAKAVRIRIERGGSGTGSWSSMYLRVNGLDAAASAAGVGFWAKSGTKERMVLRFAIDEGPTQKEVLYQRIEVGPEWQQIRVMFQDLKVSWGPGGNGRVDRERVRGIGFDAGEGGRDLEIWVDRIELIKR
ncbi:MAG TPA: hypothetical protein VI643_06320, partial [Planctomycetota bacterium]|nr:hypothetical protein [Planctomycetota bacterium]